MQNAQTPLIENSRSVVLSCVAAAVAVVVIVIVIAIEATTDIDRSLASSSSFLYFFCLFLPGPEAEGGKHSVVRWFVCVIKLTARSWGRELKRRFPGAGVGGERETERETVHSC